MSYRIGIDLGGTFVKYGAVDENGNILTKDKIPTPAGCDYGATVSAIAEAVKGMIADMGASESVGIGCPGVIDDEHGMVVTGGNLGWENMPLAQDLGKQLGIPVTLCNDANAAAYGEYTCGAGKEYKSIVLITLGTGVGSGVIFGGKLFTGELGAGAELGHEVIRMDGEPCACGRRGCFETYASASALVRQTKNAMIAHPESKMWELCKGSADNADGRTVFDGMRRGDDGRTTKRRKKSWSGILIILRRGSRISSTCSARRQCSSAEEFPRKGRRSHSPGRKWWTQKFSGTADMRP